MKNMIVEFENRGFMANKYYDSANERYRFVIKKNGHQITGYFEYRPEDSHDAREDRQWKFIEEMCDRYDEKYNKPVSSSDDIFSELWRNNGRAYLSTAPSNGLAIPVCIETINCRSDEAPSFEGHFVDLNYTGGCNGGFEPTINDSKAPPAKIKVVHFSNGVTTVIWEDGVKSQVRCQEGDTFDPEKGLALAIAKRALGNKGSWYDDIKKWTDKYHAESLDAIGDVSFDENGNTSAITFENHTDIRCSTCRFVKTPVTQIPCCGCDMGYSCWEPNEDVVQDAGEVNHYDPIEEAYNLAIKARDGKDVNIEDIIGFLGEALDE
jgi:hypothetical protein